MSPVNYGNLIYDVCKKKIKNQKQKFQIIQVGNTSFLSPYSFAPLFVLWYNFCLPKQTYEKKIEFVSFSFLFFPFSFSLSRMFVYYYYMKKRSK